ncbi:MAG: YicC/YloC family endoribonuclease [Longimicrobiales bacterium]|nr:YicC/YloC family endoribonuclease [Longimicrobiales bacterium]
MTGFGEAEVQTAAGTLRAEIRTVNHRFFSTNIRTSAALDRWEPRIKEWLKAHISRGHVNATYRLEEAGAETGPALTPDMDRARSYLRAFRRLKEELELPGEVTLEMLSRQSDLIVREPAGSIDVDEDAIREVTDRASRAVIAMREEEGRNLAVDLEARLAAIADSLAVVEERAPARLDAERERLRRSVAELAADVTVDDERLAREIALIADRWDISEEVVRLHSHIDHFGGMLAEDADEPVGKRLSFLVQEMHREANTIGSKANDAEIEHRVVAIKNEIERLREQVENVE